MIILIVSLICYGELCSWSPSIHLGSKIMLIYVNKIFNLIPDHISTCKYFLNLKKGKHHCNSARKNNEKFELNTHLFVGPLGTARKLEQNSELLCSLDIC